LRFDRWLADRTGLPRVLVERMVVRGSVRIDGVVCRDIDLDRPPAAVGEVTIDGRAV